MDSRIILQGYPVEKEIDRSIPSRSDENVPVTWEETSTLLLRSHLLSAAGNLLPEYERFGRVYLFDKTPPKANLSDGKSLNSAFTPTRKICG